jgi:uncharacterized protein Usg
LLAGKEQCC